jgi:hypothetical protein
VACCAAIDGSNDRAGLTCVGLAETVNVWHPYSSESKYFGSSPSISIFFFMFFTHKHSTKIVQ